MVLLSCLFLMGFLAFLVLVFFSYLVPTPVTNFLYKVLRATCLINLIISISEVSHL